MSTTTVYIDVTNVLRSGMTTGIQRVVRQVVPRLVARADEELQIRMLRFDSTSHRYEELVTPSALVSLADSEQPAGVEGDRAIGEFAPGDVFLDLDPMWTTPLKRSVLYPALKGAGVTIVSYVYDLVPLQVPAAMGDTTTANWIVWFSAVLAHSDLVMTDSRSAENDFLDWKLRLGVERHIPTLVTRLGCELPSVEPATPDERAVTQPFSGGRFLLFVGTIEPRKQQLLALEAFDLLSREHPDLHLVFAGRRGWINEHVYDTLDQHPLHGSRVHWVESPSDSLLVELYEAATACVYLSLYEGFGLPIAEALGHGRVTIASRGSSMYEVGREACDYTYFDTAPEIADTLAQYLGDADLLRERERHIREVFHPVGWDKVAETIELALRGLPRAAALRSRPRPTGLQLVLVSDNTENLRRAIELYDVRAPFVTEYVVVAPADRLESVSAIESTRPLVVVDESRIIAGREAEFLAADAQARSWMLHAGLVGVGEIDDVFVLLDDDSLPLGEIGVDDFIDEDGRFNAYYFFDLIRWPGRATSFDDGQRATAAALDPEGFELLSYASHQPQIIDKALLAEAVRWADEWAGPTNLCEWSIYFNHAATRYPTLFNKRVFRTLNWPCRPGDWAPPYPPSEYRFENFYPPAYSTGLFEGLTAADGAGQKLTRTRATMSLVERSRQLHQAARPLIARDGLGHGAIRFATDDVQVLVSGLPQLITTAANSVLHLDLSFQLLGVEAKQHEIEIGCRVRDQAEPGTRIRAADQAPVTYETGAASLAIVGRDPGVYDVEYVVRVDGDAVRAQGIRYLAKLVVVAAGEGPVKGYRAIAAQHAGPADARRPAKRRRPAEPPKEASAQSPTGLADLIRATGVAAPVYGLRGIGAEAPDQTLTRARVIEDHLGRVVGKRLLVIGSGFGFLPMYFAERGAKAIGWEQHAGSLEVARRAAKITGSTASFASPANMLEQIAAIDPTYFDIAIVDPAVDPGSQHTTRWIEALAERVPIVIHDGATGLQARPRVAVDQRVLGHFPWRSDPAQRALVVRHRPRIVTVNDRDYAYETSTSEAYVGSPMARQDRFRRYYFGPTHVVKEYHYRSEKEQEWLQPVREIDLYADTLADAKIWHGVMPVDSEILPGQIRIVYETIAGRLLRDLAPLDAVATTSIARDVLTSLRDLAAAGVSHNDIRSWNVIVGDEGAWLIDYGLASVDPSEDNAVAVVWMLHAALTGQAEAFATGKDVLPERVVFASTPLAALFDVVAAGERDWTVLLDSLPESGGPA